MSDNPIVSGYGKPRQLTAIERRAVARGHMDDFTGIGKFMYLLHSPLVRRAFSSEGVVVHSIIDAVNILSESKGEPRQFWSDTKKRIIRDDPQLSEKIRQLPLPAWTDGKQYKVDVASAGALLIIVFELHTPLANQLRHYIADIFDQYDSRHHANIIADLERTSGWAATRVHEDMKGLERYTDSELDWWQR